MIELAPHTAVMVYLSIMLAGMLGIWVYHHFRTRKKTVMTSDQSLQTCEYCHTPYLAEAEKKVSQCPECRCYNKQTS